MDTELQDEIDRLSDDYDEHRIKERERLQILKDFFGQLRRQRWAETVEPKKFFYNVGSLILKTQAQLREVDAKKTH